MRRSQQSLLPSMVHVAEAGDAAVTVGGGRRAEEVLWRLSSGWTALTWPGLATTEA